MQEISYNLYNDLIQQHIFDIQYRRNIFFSKWQKKSLEDLIINTAVIQ